MLITLLVFVLIAVLLVFLFNQLPLDERTRRFATAALVVVLIVWLILFLAGYPVLPTISSRRW